MPKDRSEPRSRQEENCQRLPNPSSRENQESGNSHRRRNRELRGIRRYFRPKQTDSNRRYTDHVSLARVAQEENGRISALADECKSILEQKGALCLWPNGNKRGINYSNLVAVRQKDESQLQNYSISGLLATLQVNRRQHASVSQQLVTAKLAVSQDDGLGLVSMAISLLCPLNKQRIETPVRTRFCSHLQCFDAAAYFYVTYRKTLDKWKCPVCNIQAPFKDLIVDEFMIGLLEKLPKEVHQVEFLWDGTWRAKQGVRSNMSAKQITLKGNSLGAVDLTFSPEPTRQHLVIDLTESPMPNKHIKFTDVVDLTMSP